MLAAMRQAHCEGVMGFRRIYLGCDQAVFMAMARDGLPHKMHWLPSGGAHGYGAMGSRTEYVGCHEAVSVATARQASRKEYVGCHEAVHMATAR